MGDLRAERESEQITCFPGYFGAILMASWMAISSLGKTSE